MGEGQLDPSQPSFLRVKRSAMKFYSAYKLWFALDLHISFFKNLPWVAMIYIYILQQMIYIYIYTYIYIYYSTWYIFIYIHIYIYIYIYIYTFEKKERTNNRSIWYTTALHACGGWETLFFELTKNNLFAR